MALGVPLRVGLSVSSPRSAALYSGLSTTIPHAKKRNDHVSAHLSYIPLILKSKNVFLHPQKINTFKQMSNKEQKDNDSRFVKASQFVTDNVNSLAVIGIAIVLLTSLYFGYQKFYLVPHYHFSYRQLNIDQIEILIVNYAKSQLPKHLLDH